MRPMTNLVDIGDVPAFDVWGDTVQARVVAGANASLALVDLAIVVGTLYQVESYVRLVESLAPDDIWDLAEATGSWARAAIDALQEGIALVRPGHADG